MDELIIAESQEVLPIRPVKPRKPISPNSLVGKRKDGAPKNQGLTPKQKKFCDKIQEGKSPRAAALLSGYTVNTANVASTALMENPHIASELRIRSQSSARLREMTPEMITDNLVKMANANIMDYFDENGKINLAQISRDQGYAIQEFYYDSNSNPKIRLADRQGASLALARLKKMGMGPELSSGEEGQQITVQYIDSLVQNHTTNIQNNSFQERESRLLQQSE